jgi:TonB family protein
MPSTNSIKNLLLILAGIIILALMAADAIISGKLPGFLDPYGLLFVLVGGVALVLISFPGSEIRSALKHAVGVPGNNAEIRHSAFFWEAAARGFWMLGGLRCILNLIIAFVGMKSEETAGLGAIIGRLAQCLLATFYGILLAAICLIPCWKLMGKLRSRPSLPDAGQNELPISARPGWGFGTTVGYVLFLAVLAFTAFNFSFQTLWELLPAIFNWPAVLVVLGGTVAVIIFVGGTNSSHRLSIIFALMGLIASLIGFIQVLLGVASFSVKGPSSIADVAGGIAFVIGSCFIALLGMVLVGAPTEDHAIRMGRITAPSVFSRVSWYVFPLLILILGPIIIQMVVTPMPKDRPQLTEVSAPALEQPSRYEGRAPQSEPMDFLRANIQEGFLIYKVNPAYPEEARREGAQGTVKLTVIINEEGFVYEVEGNPGNNPILEKAAIPAVKRWRFRPFLMKDVPVALKTTVTVTFAPK